MDIMEKYNKTAAIYNRRYRKIQREKYKQMLAGIELQGKILDLGCGTGLLSKFLKQNNLFGVDSSIEMLKIRGSGNLADIEKLPYKNAEFDYVLSFTTLQNCKHPEAALREVKRILKPSGLFICTFLRAFKPKLKPLLKKYFKIKGEKPCGEDVGFILKIKQDTSKPF